MWSVEKWLNSGDMEEQNLENLSRRERRKLFHEQQREGKRVISLKSVVIKWLLIVGVIGLITAAGWWLLTRPGISEEEIVSRKGLHWHPGLTIIIKGEKQEISANIGIGAVHQPIHTHDSTGVLHLEIQGLVTKEEIKLGQFFKIWGKDFSSNCIFEFCNGEDGNVKMIVNGQENKDFENYLMKDKDRIEIRYE